MLIIVSIFEDKISEIIEEKEYEKIENPASLTIWQEVKLLLRNLGWNVIFLPAYLIPGIEFIIFSAEFLSCWKYSI